MNNFPHDVFTRKKQSVMFIQFFYNDMLHSLRSNFALEKAMTLTVCFSHLSIKSFWTIPQIMFYDNKNVLDCLVLLTEFGYICSSLYFIKGLQRRLTNISFTSYSNIEQTFLIFPTNIPCFLLQCKIGEQWIRLVKKNRYEIGICKAVVTPPTMVRKKSLVPIHNPCINGSNTDIFLWMWFEKESKDNQLFFICGVIIIFFV